MHNVSYKINDDRGSNPLSHNVQSLPVDSAFKLRAGAALAISVAADAFDYVAAPVLTPPVIGDIPDAIVTSIPYAITRSKRRALLNMIEFVPLIGDFVPTYSLTTVMWTHGESRKKKWTVMSQS